MSSEVVKLHEQSTFRDLSRPLGFMTENDRAAAYEEHYKNMVRDKESLPFYFGTYVSNVATTIFYTYRL